MPSPESRRDSLEQTEDEKAEDDRSEQAHQDPDETASQRKG